MSRLHCFPLLLSSMALALGLASAPALGQDDPPPEYLVELVILEPTDARSDAWPIDELATFDVRADPALVRRVVDSIRRVWPLTDWAGLPVPEPLAPRVGVLPNDDEDDGDSQERDANPPEPVERAVQWMALEPPPASLLDAARRLTRDGSFRLVTQQAWLQPSGTPRRPQPARVRDEVVIYVEPVERPVDDFEAIDPTLDDDRRGGAAIDALGRPEAPIQPQPRPMDNGTFAIEGRTSAGRFVEGMDEPFTDAESRSAPDPLPLPPVPKAATRVDGTVALVQRQFLHAELDLHWREPIQRPGQLEAARTAEPVEATATNPDSMTESSEGPDGDAMSIRPATGPEPNWQVHRLTQSRVIRPDQWAYFDSDRFGVLIRATELPPLLPLPEPEAEPEADDALLDGTPDAIVGDATTDPGGS